MAHQSPNTLLAAFLAAHYHVYAPTGALILRIGRHNPQLASLMQHCGVSTLSILTAYNPDAQKVDEKINETAQNALENHLRERGILYLTGKNVDPTGAGPAEPTYVVFGLDLDQAHELARQLRQVAFVTADAHATPKLVWTSPNPGILTD